MAQTRSLADLGDKLDLDEAEHHFEGTEKLIEIWFKRADEENAADESPRNLLVIRRETWEKILDQMGCKILSFIANDRMVAYLLSESSLIVSKHRLILKTCGTTRPISILGSLLDIVKKECGLTEIADVFYSRKNFHRPDLQWGPYRKFEKEVEILDNYFNGAAYCLGKMNSDCCYLYTQNDFTRTGITEPDQTLEVIMMGLDTKSMDVFWHSENRDANEVTKESGIHTLCEGAIIDAYIFEPCGYSCNAILLTEEGYEDRDLYFNIHITPEDAFSYVSFETNVPRTCYVPLVEKLAKMFKPQKFLVTVFSNDRTVVKHTTSNIQDLNVHGFVRCDIQLCEMQNYDLGYVMMKKVDEKSLKKILPK